MSSERRQGNRCPECQGPAREDEAMPQGMRCRNSLCRFNHQHHGCPRCKLYELEHVTQQGETYTYSCGNCLHKWQPA